MKRVQEMINRVVRGEDSKKVVEEFFQEESGTAHHDWITPLQNYGFNWRTSTATEEFWWGSLQGRDYTIGIKGDDSWSIVASGAGSEGPAGSGQGLEALQTKLNQIQNPQVPSDWSLYD